MGRNKFHGWSLCTKIDILKTGNGCLKTNDMTCRRQLQLERVSLLFVKMFCHLCPLECMTFALSGRTNRPGVSLLRRHSFGSSRRSA